MKVNLKELCDMLAENVGADKLLPIINHLEHINDNQISLDFCDQLRKSLGDPDDCGE